MGKTLAQKIFDAHTVDTPAPGVRVLSLDRVFCHEITTPIAINDLVAIGKDRVFDPEKIKAAGHPTTTAFLVTDPGDLAPTFETNVDAQAGRTVVIRF